ncbi:DUF397 domain-containing protein [Streptomyces sp. TR06-5]|uniref:DUF397 domain-containing protein n=1 Tax=unclassified Streptomyces TaxID=2593676 RepID=UPI00399F8106
MTLESTGGDATPLQWTKSSYSTNDGPDCVEVAASGTVQVRDSKNVHGPRLRFAPAAWRAFVDHARG